MTQRWLAFLIGCIGTRLLFVIVARFASTKILPLLGYLALLPAFGFAYLWLFNQRLSGFEAGGKIWWHSLRIIHSILYFTFAYLAIIKNTNAYLALALDVTLGLTFFFLHHGFGLFN